MEGWFGYSGVMYESGGGSPKMYRLKGRIKNVKDYENDIILDLIVDGNDREHFMANDSRNRFWCDSACWHLVGGYDPTKRYYERSIKLNKKNAIADDIFGIDLSILVDKSSSPDGFMVRDMVICPDANFLYILNGYHREFHIERDYFVGVNRTDKVTLEVLRDMARSWKVFGPCNEEHKYTFENCYKLPLTQIVPDDIRKALPENPYADVIMSRDEMARTLTDGLYTFENCYIRSVTYLGDNARRIGILVDSHSTVRDVLNSMNPEQTKVLYYLIGQAIDDEYKEIKKLKEEKQEEKSMRDKYTIIARDAESNRVCHSVNITRVVFNKPATIVLWSDGTKTVVKCSKGEKFDKEKGLAMAIVKKTLGNEGFYFNIISNWVKNGKDENPASEKSAPAPKKTTRKSKKS